MKRDAVAVAKLERLGGMDARHEQCGRKDKAELESVHEVGVLGFEPRTKGL